jgi:hypothetical protein
MDKVSRTERSMWAGPTLIFFFHVEHGPVACGLWCVLVGGTHPFFLFPLEGWGNTPNPLSFWDFLKPTVLNFIFRSIQNPAQTRDHVVAHVHAAPLNVNCAVVLEFIPKSL